MFKRFLAKSFIEETIQEHTDNLIKELDRLKSIYSDINVDWDLLEIACIHHDLGKINTEFQNKIRNIKNPNLEVSHGLLSACFIDTDSLEEIYSDDDIRILYYAVAFHHDRKTVREVEDWIVDEKCIELEKALLDFEYDKYNNRNELYFMPKFLNWSKIEGNPTLHKRYIFLKGMLNKIDYAASAYVPVEIKNDYLEDTLDEFISKLSEKLIKQGKSGASWNDLQNYMMSNRDENLVVVAQTGMGKTEAGLLWIGNDKGFFTLPIRTAINSIYSRIKEDMLNGQNIENKLGLLHSETRQEYMKVEADGLIHSFNDYYSQTRQLALPLTICTLDQLFTFVFKYRNYESKLVTLSYSKIVIDEIQMYSPDIVGFLIYGLKLIQDFGGKFAILTATFPGFLKQLMLEKGLEFDMPDKEFVDDKIRHSVSWHREKLNAEFVLDKYKDNKLLVICNTVKECQRVYMELSEHIKESGEIIGLNMFHAKYIQKDRDKKAEDILKFGKLYNENGEFNTQTGIWITSSIAEASLDIDFDVLITELSDVTSLFQRMGRCYRKREWNSEGYNCYIFDGGDKICSGVGSIIDQDIFNLSKTYLREYFDFNSGNLDEYTKMKLVEKILSFQNLESTNYYKEIIQFFDLPGLYTSGELSKDEAQKMFRNINTRLVIPKKVYEDNLEEINRKLNIIYSDKSSNVERMNAKLDIKAFSMSVESNIVYQSNVEIGKIVLNLYESIDVIDCDYDSDLGFRMKKKEINSDRDFCII